MIVLDANVIVGWLDSEDPWHTAATALLLEHSEAGYLASVLTVAEVLVHPVMKGMELHVLEHIAAIGLTTLALAIDDAVALARLRAQFHIRMPDAVVLHAAIATGATLATFDSALAGAAQRAGVHTIGAP